MAGSTGKAEDARAAECDYDEGHDYGQDYPAPPS